MEFEWDEAKRQANIEKHGIDFVRARQIFDGRSVVSYRGSYPEEERWLTIGIIEGRFFTVVWTRRGEAVRLISARRSSDGEQRAYRAIHGEGT